MMTRCDSEGHIFLSHPHVIKGFFLPRVVKGFVRSNFLILVERAEISIWCANNILLFRHKPHISESVGLIINVTLDWSTLGD